MEACGFAVKFDKTRRDASEAVLTVGGFVYLHCSSMDEVAHGTEIGTEIFVVDVHEMTLGFVEEVDNIGGFIVGAGNGLGRDANEFA